MPDTDNMTEEDMTRDGRHGRQGPHGWHGWHGSYVQCHGWQQWWCPKEDACQVCVQVKKSYRAKGNVDSLRSLVADGALSQDQLDELYNSISRHFLLAVLAVYPAFRPFLRRVRHQRRC